MAIAGRVTYGDELDGDGAATYAHGVQHRDHNRSANPNYRKPLRLPPTTVIPAAASRTHLYIKHKRTATPQPQQIAALQMGLI